MLENYRVALQLVAFRVVLSSIELVSHLISLTLILSHLSSLTIWQFNSYMC
jgi:hypothetical protein